LQWTARWYASLVTLRAPLRCESNALLRVTWPISGHLPLLNFVKKNLEETHGKIRTL
jgi:hypothetical protein